MAQPILRGLAAWLRAARLQFYPLPLAAYAVGALLAHGSPFNLPGIAGGAAVFLVELLTVLTNEIFDYASDSVNANAGLFTGGSRVLVEGRLAPRTLRAGVIAVSLLAAAAGTLTVAASPGPAAALVLFLAALLLGLGYTVPPLALCHRGLGEPTVALASGPLPLIFGYAVQGGPLSDPWVWLLGPPLFLSILQANLLAGLPDLAADRLGGKRSLAVVLGPRAAILLSVAAAVLALPALAVVWISGGMRELSPVWLVPVGVHAAALCGALLGHMRSARLGRRMDPVLALSLAYILWFGVLPLAALLVGPFH